MEDTKPIAFEVAVVQCPIIAMQPLNPYWRLKFHTARTGVPEAKVLSQEAEQLEVLETAPLLAQGLETAPARRVAVEEIATRPTALAAAVRNLPAKELV